MLSFEFYGLSISHMTRLSKSAPLTSDPDFFLQQEDEH